MAGVKKLHQESENSAKGEYIFGHLFGGLGILADTGIGKYFCIPLALLLHDGVKAIFKWSEKPERQESHVVEMIKMAHRAVKYLGKAYLVLDRLFLTVPALSELINSAVEETVHIITKAKINCVAYKEPVAKERKRGRPAIKGEKVKLLKYFESARDSFQTSVVRIYGKTESVSYTHIDLLWGQKLYKKLRFVYAEYNGQSTILVSTDLDLKPVEIIRLYSWRFTIENTFREMKQVVNAFGYRFWSKYMPKLKRYRKKTDPEQLDAVTDENARKRIRLAMKALEGYVFCCTVATGLLQMLSIKFSSDKDLIGIRYMRTKTRTALSEATVAEYLRQNIYSLLLKFADLSIIRIIRTKQIDTYDKIDEKRAS